MAGITIRGLSKRFGAGETDVAAVDDLDLDIKDNSFVTLLGPSGCGKTTTLRLIAGYITPDRGTIEVDGRPLSSPAAVVPPEARGMGMVFQNYAVWPHKNVFQNVVFGLKLRKVPAAQARRQVEETLALVNLTGLEDRYPNELSGGQQQRVALARSLVVEPSILLLDEPLSNLDAKLRERMRTELKELQRRTGITFVYVTHDQAEALALSDQVAVMSGGRLQQYGTPFEVYAHPANRMVADFMGLVNLVPGTVRAVTNGSGRIELAPDLALDVAAARWVSARRHRSTLPSGPRTSVLALRRRSARGAVAKITNHVFLGNISEYYAALPSGQVLRVQTHPLQHFEVGDTVAIEIDATQCSVFRRDARRRGIAGYDDVNPEASSMNKPVSPAAAIRGEEHWTNKGSDVRLFLWNKHAGDPSGPAGTILFVHGSSMASQPTFDLQVPGRPPRRWISSPRGLRHLVRRHGGLRPIHQGSRPQFARSRTAPTIASPPRAISRSCAASGRSWSTAFPRARCAPRCSRSAIPRWWDGLRSTPWYGPAKARRRWPSAASGCPSFAPRIAARSTASSCARSSSATIRAPPTTT